MGHARTGRYASPVTRVDLAGGEWEGRSSGDRHALCAVNGKRFDISYHLHHKWLYQHSSRPHDRLTRRVRRQEDKI